MKERVCSGCGDPVIKFANAHFKLCAFCNRDRLLKNKPPAVRKFSSIKKKFPEATGEWKVFMEIWSERPHRCNNCKLFLPEVPEPWMFSHIKPKSTHPELRLHKPNIDVSCFECHRLWDGGTRAQFYARTNIYQ